jgi:hypothetical protein
LARDDIHNLLAGKWEDGTRPKDLYGLYVSKDPNAYIPVLIEGLRSEVARIRNGCAEIASLLSEHSPELLYSEVELFIANLDSKEKVVRWEAVCTLGNLASVDRERRIVPAIDRIARNLGDESIVLQGHSVRALGKIARANPDKAPAILDALLGSTRFFPGNRVGFVVEAMEYFLGQDALVPRIREFVEGQTRSEESVVAGKARRTLRRIQGT